MNHAGDNNNWSNIKTDQSIANQLRKVIQRVSGLALLVATIFFVILDFYSYRQSIVQQLTAVTTLIAANSTASIVFDDANAANEIIATLQHEEIISGAIIYKTDWQEFASTPMDESTKKLIDDDQSWRLEIADKKTIQHRITLTSVDVDILKPVYLKGELIAYLFVEGSLAPLYRNLMTNVFIASLIWAIVMLGVYLFSKNIHKTITGPIENLIAGMKSVSDEHDFSMHLPVIKNDEIGVITKSFNDMLEHVQSRDERLERYRNELEDKVEARTHDLKLAVTEAVTSKNIAEQANLAKSDFLATMSHEIRTPMHGILGMLDLITRTELTPKQEKYATSIKKSSDLLLAIINNILDYSKIEVEQLTLEHGEFRLDKLIDDTINMMSGQASSKNLNLYATMTPATNCTISGDSTRLTQVLINLINNAIKFTNKGEVHVNVGLEERPDTTKLLKVQVKDTGIGITEAAQKQIFNEFVQADGSMTRKYGGTGLGLAISKKLVELMGGSIHIDSKPGLGSEFTFTVVVNAVNTSSDKVIETAVDNDRTNIKILLVEDNMLNQNVGLDMLNLIGYSVQVANNGEEAVQLAKANQFDIILMDCQMPVKDGFEASSDIRKFEADTGHKNIIIALTGNALAGDKEKCLNAGMDDFLSKPFSYDQLKEILSKWLPFEKQMSDLKSL